jgi:hypothetical protein
MTDCSYPAIPKDPTAADPAIALPANTVGGTFTGSAWRLAGNAHLDLTSDLVIVVSGTVRINGDINVPADRTVDIYIVSLDKDVEIAGNIGRGAGTPGTISRRTATATGGNGSSGGVIKLIAKKGKVEVTAAGNILAQYGGDGGEAMALGSLAVPPKAWARSGQGGAGGDVVLCALEGIQVAGSVESGRGGNGGRAMALAFDGEQADASALGGGDAGNIYFHGSGANTMVAVDGIVQAGEGGAGGRANAQGGSGPFGKAGGPAEARTSNGGNGGTVEFDACKVWPGFNRIAAGMSGNGQLAEAIGGDGASYGPDGAGGGNAKAHAGSGGQPGATPQVPTPNAMANGQPAVFRGGAGGHGGDGKATGGSGGDGVNSVMIVGTGGWSGTSSATGGAGLTGPATPVPAAGASPPGPAGAMPAPNGGAGKTVVAPGSP